MGAARAALGTAGTKMGAAGAALGTAATKMVAAGAALGIVEGNQRAAGEALGGASEETRALWARRPTERKRLGVGGEGMGDFGPQSETWRPSLERSFLGTGLVLVLLSGWTDGIGLKRLTEPGR